MHSFGGTCANYYLYSVIFLLREIYEVSSLDDAQLPQQVPPGAEEFGLA